MRAFNTEQRAVVCCSQVLSLNAVGRPPAIVCGTLIDSQARKCDTVLWRWLA